MCPGRISSSFQRRSSCPWTTDFVAARRATARMRTSTRSSDARSYAFSFVLPLWFSWASGGRRSAWWDVLNGHDVDRAVFSFVSAHRALVRNRGRDDVFIRRLFGNDQIRNPTVAQRELVVVLGHVVPADDRVRRAKLWVRCKGRRVP